MTAEENLLREIFQAPPVEKLQAAIEKLERFRGKQPESGEREWRQAANGVGWIMAHDGTPVAGSLTQADVNLILMLHRTIDAQLSILRFAVKRLEAVTTLTGLHLQAHEHEIALADAILGGDS